MLGACLINERLVELGNAYRYVLRQSACGSIRLERGALHKLRENAEDEVEGVAHLEFPDRVIKQDNAAAVCQGVEQVLPL
jgi:hypothetical protein